MSSLTDVLGVNFVGLTVIFVLHLETREMVVVVWLMGSRI